jgi:NADP-dependent 3-hydroxy acid dehydrogenase YdfG
MNNLTDKLVLITGASSGIGAETAKVISSKNATVILLARNIEKLGQVSTQINQQGGKSYYYAVDLSNSEQVANYIVEIIEKNKRVLIKPGIFKILFFISHLVKIKNI